MKKILLLALFVSLPNITVANERFIPLELFTGGKIRSDTEIKFTQADLIFGEKKRKKNYRPSRLEKSFYKRNH